MNSTELQEFENIKKELHVDPNGNVFVSRNGLARLSGVSPRTIGRLIDSGALLVSKIAKIKTPEGFRQAHLISDIEASNLIKNQAYKGNKTAQLSLDAFIAIGFRAWGRELLNWQPKPTELPTIPEMLLAQAQLLVDQDNKIKEMDSRLTEIELRRKDAIKALAKIEPPKVSAAPRKEFADINEFVRAFCIKNNLDFSLVWRKIHAEFRYRYSLDLIRRGNNHKPKLSGVQMAAHIDMLQELYAVAVVTANKLLEF